MEESFTADDDRQLVFQTKTVVAALRLPASALSLLQDPFFAVVSFGQCNEDESETFS